MAQNREEENLLINEEKEKAYLVGVNINNDPDFERSMAELAELAKACNMEVVGTITQSLERVNIATYIGPGKVEEATAAAQMLHADIVIFNESLTPSQLRNLQDAMHMPVMDRSALILEIFASRARTREAKMQVEVARLQYMLPRLIGLHDALSRQGGGSGSMSNKGAGEKKLELDRRRLEQRLTQLRRELEQVGQERATQRKRRSQAGLPRVALVGYTNAGKSTLMNALLEMCAPKDEELAEKRVMEKDMLFATLDTTVRKLEPENHPPILLSDTVGFIDKLPHHLVEAFMSTLEEAREADLLLQVVDCSDPHYQDHLRVTGETLKSLNAEHIPMIIVYNKADKVLETSLLPKVQRERQEIRIYMSARELIGLDTLLDLINECLGGGYEICRMCVPYTDGRALSYLQEHGVVTEVSYEPEGTYFTVNCKKEDAAYYAKYKV